MLVFAKTLNVLVLLLNFVLIANSQISMERNLDGYVAGPTFEDYDSRFPPVEGEDPYKKIRPYLWDLWSNKKQAYFKLNKYTLEGRGIFCTYYVEKNKTGFWQVASECDRIQNCPYVSKKDCENYRYLKNIYDKIEKIDGDGGKFTLYLWDSISKEKIQF